MKILHINASYKPAYIYGGPTMSVSKLCEALVKTGEFAQVFTTTANGHNELNVVTNRPEMVDGVPVHYFKRITKDHSHFSPALLKAIWKQGKQFDIIHIHAWWNTVSVLACFIAIVRGIPVVISPRGTLSNYSFHNKNAFLKRCIHFFVSRPMLKRSYIHATSNHEETALKAIIEPKHSFTIPNFVDLPTDIIINEVGFTGTLKLLFLSRIEEKKGLDILIKALTHLNIPYHLTIAGSGNEDYINYLKSLAETQGVSAHISWIGFRNKDKFAIFASHHLLILPSYDENFGNVVIESLYTGTAVIISKYVGLAGYVHQHDLGWICDTDPISLANIINNVNLQTLSAIKLRAPIKISEDFDEDHLIKNYTGMYNEIIKKR